MNEVVTEIVQDEYYAGKDIWIAIYAIMMD
jgi:hypothetical protein